MQTHPRVPTCTHRLPEMQACLRPAEPCRLGLTPTASRLALFPHLPRLPSQGPTSSHICPRGARRSRGPHRWERPTRCCSEPRAGEPATLRGSGTQGGCCRPPGSSRPKLALPNPKSRAGGWQDPSPEVAAPPWPEGPEPGVGTPPTMPDAQDVAANCPGTPGDSPSLLREPGPSLQAHTQVVCNSSTWADRLWQGLEQITQQERHWSPCLQASLCCWGGRTPTLPSGRALTPGQARLHTYTPV